MHLKAFWVATGVTRQKKKKQQNEEYKNSNNLDDALRKNSTVSKRRALRLNTPEGLLIGQQQLLDRWLSSCQRLSKAWVVLPREGCCRGQLLWAAVAVYWVLGQISHHFKFTQTTKRWRFKLIVTKRKEKNLAGVWASFSLLLTSNDEKNINLKKNVAVSKELTCGYTRTGILKNDQFCVALPSKMLLASRLGVLTCLWYTALRSKVFCFPESPFLS